MYESDVGTKFLRIKKRVSTSALLRNLDAAAVLQQVNAHRIFIGQ